MLVCRPKTELFSEGNVLSCLEQPHLSLGCSFISSVHFHPMTSHRDWMCFLRSARHDLGWGYSCLASAFSLWSSQTWKTQGQVWFPPMTIYSPGFVLKSHTLPGLNSQFMVPQNSWRNKYALFLRRFVARVRFHIVYRYL